MALFKRKAAKRRTSGIAVRRPRWVIPNGTRIRWKYRDTWGHGYVVGVRKLGRTAATTEYKIRQTDHHVSAAGRREPRYVYHFGSDIRRE